jgi:hypothetical protein
MNSRMRGRLGKLTVMSWGEIVHRLRYRQWISVERRRHAHGRLRLPGGLREALRPEFQREPWPVELLASRRARVPLWPPGADRIREVFAHSYIHEREDMRARAADARAHRFSFFGQSFTYGADIPWQDDPVTGRPWPARFHADVPVHRGDIGAGDVKHVWELSRQQFLIDLGKSVFLDGNDESLEALRRLVRSWIAGNPYATGVNWACALEPAFRSFSWLWAYALSQHTLDDEFHVEWLESFFDHGRFIEQHLEHYSSPYNHLIGEAAALFMLGASFPEFSDAARWKAAARSVLEGRLAEQFYLDGGSVEQSPFYHHATVGYYLLAALTARRIGEDLSPAVWQAVEQGLDYSMALLQPDGRTPEIGGADDGKPIRMEHLPFWDFRPYLAIGAVLFERGDFKARAGRFHEDALWLLGAEGLRSFEDIPTAQPAATSIALPHSGYYVMRSDWSDRADYVCVDCGEQAAGMRRDSVPNSMHGHADCLSAIVWLRGRRVLVDSGLFAYNCGGAWEAHFRETAAHNTARVDGRDQAVHLGKMAWSHSYSPCPEGWHTGEGGAWVLGSHDAYARGPSPVTHRRAVWLRPDHVVVVCDEFVGVGHHELEVNFQFAPGASLTLHTSSALARYGEVAELGWVGTGRWTVHTAEGGDGPDQGWVAPSLGIRVPAPRLTLRCGTQAPRTHLVTLFAAPLVDTPRVMTFAEEGDGGQLLLVRNEGGLQCVGSGLVSRGTALDTDAVLAAGLVGEGLVEGDCIGGTYAQIDGARLSALLTSRPVAPGWTTGAPDGLA